MVPKTGSEMIVATDWEMTAGSGQGRDSLFD